MIATIFVLTSLRKIPERVFVQVLISGRSAWNALAILLRGRLVLVVELPERLFNDIGSPKVELVQNRIVKSGTGNIDILS